MDDATKQAMNVERERVRALPPGELATLTLEVIEENLDRWNQNAWRQDNSFEPEICSNPVSSIERYAEDPLNPRCTTSFCFAGWVAALDEVKWVKNDPDRVGDPKKCDCTSYCCLKPAQHAIYVSDYAARRLELDPSEASTLFHGDNQIDELRAGVEAIVAGGNVIEAIEYSKNPDYYDDEDDDDE